MLPWLSHSPAFLANSVGLDETFLGAWSPTYPARRRALLFPECGLSSAAALRENGKEHGRIAMEERS
jgi:hypothetical protein